MMFTKPSLDKLLSSRERRPHVVACGGWGETYQDVINAHNNAQFGDDVIVLLVDSETNVAPQRTANQHLTLQAGWTFPTNPTNDQIHMMVQCMEAWFMADKDAVAEYYDGGFARKRLPNNPNIEAVSKSDILQGFDKCYAKHEKGRLRQGLGFLCYSWFHRRNEGVCRASPNAARLRDFFLQVLE